MLGNLGTALSGPANLRAHAPVVSAAPAVPAATHASGLPTKPPAGINPKLWSSVLQHLQQTNFGKNQQAPNTAAPMPSMPRQSGTGFIGMAR